MAIFIAMMAIFIAIVATRRNRTQYVIYPYNFDYRNFRTLNDDDNVIFWRTKVRIMVILHSTKFDD